MCFIEINISYYYMGAGILPVTIHNNKLHFLFGKENKFEKSAPGFSDFGGGSELKESYIQTAVREACEETTGFFGSEKDILRILNKAGQYHIDVTETYRMFLFPIKYDPMLVVYYNNNQKFIQKRLDESVIKTSKIFEKAEMRWICIDDLLKNRNKFRHYFVPILDKLIKNKDEINKLTTQVVNKKTRKVRE
jgi:hypothetical protein